MSFYIKKSPINGLGVFAKRDIQPNEIIEIVATKHNGVWVVNEYFGKWVNHSEKYRNSEITLTNGSYMLKAIKFIFQHDEILSDYMHRSTPIIFKRPDFKVVEVEPASNFRPRTMHNYRGKTSRG